MVVPVEWLVLDVALHARFLVSFAGCRIGMGSIVVNTTLGKRPASAAGADQQELGLVVFEPIANCCYMNTFACEIAVDIRRPE